MDFHLLLTRLRPPSQRLGVPLVPRPRLCQQLDAAVSSRLILVSAPTGFGKTTAFDQWLRQGDHPAAWLAVDESDNDPAQFWRYFLAACRSVAFPDSERLAAPLPDTSPAAIQSALIDLLNQLSEGQRPLYIVLDDYHLIHNPTIHAALASWLEHLPPQLHLALITRSDPPLPFARLRARRELLEIRSEHLRFSPEEAAAFLTGIMGLELEPDDIAALEERTEGWIAGLQLAALSLQRCPDAQAFIQSFSGSQRQVMDYLLEEVLQNLDGETQRFLLCTSLLARLSGPLCDALLETTGGQAQLERLERANLFIVPLDDQRRWYRYHHLFADLLRARLLSQPPGEAPAIPELHRRASLWYESAGDIDQAVAHAFATPDPARAAHLAEQYGGALLNGNRLVTLLGWIERLPFEHVAASPYLCMGCGWVYALTQQLDRAETCLGLAEAALDLYVPRYIASEQRVVTREELQADLAAVHAFCARARGDAQSAYAFSQQALERIPAGDPVARSAVALNLGLLCLESGDLAEAQARFAEAVQPSALPGENLLVTTTALHLRGNVLEELGDLGQAAACYQQIIDLTTRQPAAPGSLAYLGHFGLAGVHLQRDEAAGALWHLEDALKLALPQEDSLALQTVVGAYLLRARLALLAADLPQAQDWLDHADQFARAHHVETLDAARACLRGEWHLARGEIDAAAQWAPAGLPVEALQPPGEASAAHHLPAWLRSRLPEALFLARLWLAQGRSEPAAVLLERLVALAGASSFPVLLEANLLLALAHAARRALAHAHQHLRRALALAEPQGYLLPFLSASRPLETLLRQAVLQDTCPPYAQAVLSALRDRAGRSAAAFLEAGAALLEPLTPRERQIIRLLAAGLSSTQVAGDLVIAVSTARSYIKTIYRKLGAHTRQEAVARARSAGLL